MTGEQPQQIEDLQKTLMIPVLSLQPAGQRVRDEVNGVQSTHTQPGDPRGTTVLAADVVCERILLATTDATCAPNAIVGCAMALTMMAGQLRTASAPANFTQFSQLLINAVREFDRNLLHTQVRHDTALVARYILCCAVDEGILSTPWGIASGWAHRSLLRLFHNEANGGERFFSLLEHAITHQHECHELLELFYLCLSIGFEGRLHLDPRGQDKIEALRMQVFRILYGNLPRNTALSPHWKPQESISSPAPKRPSLQVVAIVATFITVLGFAGLRFWLHISATSTADAYEHHFEMLAAGND